MEKEYYIVENESRVGPLTFEQLREKGLDGSTLVWTAGMSDWTRADSCPELQSLLVQQTATEESAFGSYAEPEQPASNQAYQQSQSNQEQAPYGQQQSPYGQQPPYGRQQYGNQAPYQGQPSGFNGGQYGDPNVQVNTNWKTLSIIATVLGFLFSCVGGIVGIFAILEANKAERATMMGNYLQAKSNWSSCKTLSIISFVLAGIGILGNVMWFSALF